MRQKTSLENHDLSKLWKNFLSQRNKINGQTTNELISLAVYSPTYFDKFDARNQFERWVALEVGSFENVPKGMKTFVLPRGLYAIFSHKGISTDYSVFQYIFSTWLPSSDYLLDNRPHLEILGDRYKNNDPNSEEEILIPVKNKDVGDGLN